MCWYIWRGHVCVGTHGGAMYVLIHMEGPFMCRYIWRGHVCVGIYGRAMCVGTLGGAMYVLETCLDSQKLVNNNR